MKIACWTNCLSPHQLPLAREIVKRIGEENYKYLYAEELPMERLELGWDNKPPAWCEMGFEDSPELMEADLVYTGGLRPLDLLARRIAAGKRTFYVTERWFKPLSFMGMELSGRKRLLSWGYWRMARRMVKMLNNPLCKVLAIGPWAKKDMIEIGVNEGQIEEWGYFVERSDFNTEAQRLRGSENLVGRGNAKLLKVLWVGRMIGLKRVDTIIKAVKNIAKSEEMKFDIELTLVGDGVARNSLEGKVGQAPVVFKDPQPIDKVRRTMREHDVYVFSSDAHDGWGAVVNEALEEGMKVLGTYETGACAAMLPEEDLFHAGDWKTLAKMLAKCGRDKRHGELKGQGIGKWTPQWAAERMLSWF